MTPNVALTGLARRASILALLGVSLALYGGARAAGETQAAASSRTSNPTAPGTHVRAPKVPAPRVIKAEDWPAEKARLAELGKQHADAWDLYQYFLKQAGTVTHHTKATIPDWSGWYTVGDVGGLQGGRALNVDPDQPEHGFPTAKLTPKYEALLRQRLKDFREKQIMYDDRLPNCLPPGFPRWIVEPWGREFVPTPGETWLMNEIANEVRRIYTDGRGHTPKEDAEPSYDGDTIGFWDGDALVAHTRYLVKGKFQVFQPDHTANIEAVEIWRKTTDDQIEAYFWFYDPEVLVEPWFVRRMYKRDQNPDLRIRYYDCKGSEQNAVTEPPDKEATFKH